MDWLAEGLTEMHPSDGKALSGRLRNTVRLDPPLYQGLINSSRLNSDDDDDNAADDEL